MGRRRRNEEEGDAKNPVSKHLGFGGQRALPGKKSDNDIHGQRDGQKLQIEFGPGGDLVMGRHEGWP
jgi:hypothetical protein